MGPPENPTQPLEKQEARGRKRPASRARRTPRARGCLLKGCEQRFHPRHARQRYCSDECRKAARKWSEWKGRRVYRGTAAGKQKRNGQSQRYRKRVKERKPPEKEAVPETARVITKKLFFRWLLRPSWLLRGFRALAAIPAATLLLAGLPARDGARLGTRAALAKKVCQARPSTWKAALCAAAVKAQR
jgi:hypothetical protein